MTRIVLTLALLGATAVPSFAQYRSHSTYPQRQPAFFLSLGRRADNPALYALLQQIVTNQQLLLQRDRRNDPAVTAALQSLSVAVQKIADNQQQILLLLNDLRKPVPDVEGKINEQQILSELREIRARQSEIGRRQQEIGQLIPQAPLNPLQPQPPTRPLQPAEPRNPLQPAEPSNPLQPGSGDNPLMPGASSRPRYFRDFTILRR